METRRAQRALLRRVHLIVIVRSPSSRPAPAAIQAHSMPSICALAPFQPKILVPHHRAGAERLTPLAWIDVLPIRPRRRPNGPIEFF